MNDNDSVSVKIENVSKDFVLPHERTNSIKSLFTGLSKKKNNKNETQHALKNISFEIKKGEFFGIVGRNGSGKSTLLKILAGIYQPTEGKIFTKGKLVPFIELGVGFNPELTGRENVYLNGAMLGFSQKETDEMYPRIVEFAELERFMDQKLKNYSSGMQVRLAFSLAIRAKAEILLVDEVLAVGDADFQRKCFDYFQSLKGDDTTVIFVSHNMDAIREYCDRAALIENNHLIDVDNADIIAKQYSQLFIKKSQPGITKESKRWGNNKVRYKKVYAEEITDKIDTINIYAETISSVDINEIIIGFGIKNAAKQALAGSNNVIEGKPLRNIKKGQKINIKWCIPNIFSDGIYTVDMTILQKNGEECDWWESSTEFTILRDNEHAPYLVSPKLDLDIKTNGK